MEIRNNQSWPLWGILRGVFFSNNDNFGAFKIPPWEKKKNLNGGAPLKFLKIPKENGFSEVFNLGGVKDFFFFLFGGKIPPLESPKLV